MSWIPLLVPFSPGNTPYGIKTAPDKSGIAKLACERAAELVKLAEELEG